MVAVIAACLWLGNTPLFYNVRLRVPEVLAHRGLAQTYSRENLEADTCTAERILPPTHRYLENTITSMEAAFAIGADVVELDIHPTADGEFAVFHDWELGCRADGSGITREHSMVELRQRDIGHGYTADGGKTYPFRGKFRGAMPSLREVLATFPGKRFLINIKSNDAQEGTQLAAFLKTLTEGHQNRLMVYGGDAPVGALHAQLPAVRAMSRQTLKQCLLRYALLGWSGYVPQSCRHTMLMLPVNIAPLLWGWPHRFIHRLEEVGTHAYLIARYTGGDFSNGLNTKAELADVPENYGGGIWTDRADIIVPLVKRHSFQAL